MIALVAPTVVVTIVEIAPEHAPVPSVHVPVQLCNEIVSVPVDEAMCLAAGADDYIRKPVSPRILNLRVTNQLRRRGAVEVQEVTLLKAGGLTLDLISHELRVGTAIVPLTRTEFDFIELLMHQPKRVFTREQVLTAIGGSSDFSSDHLLDTHASRLRIKIKGVGGPKVISAVRAVGYKLFYPESEPDSEIA